MAMIENKFRQTVDDSGLHLRELARQSGVSFNTLWKIYHGKTTRVDFETLNQICTALKCQVTAIIAWRPDD